MKRFHLLGSTFSLVTLSLTLTLSAAIAETPDRMGRGIQSVTLDTPADRDTSSTFIALKDVGVEFGRAITPMSNDELDAIEGGFNPQPDPPGINFSLILNSSIIVGPNTRMFEGPDIRTR